MAQVRALTKMFHDGKLLEAGQIFDYPDELAKQLKGSPDEGMELVNKKTNAAYSKAQADEYSRLVETAKSLRSHYDALRAELEADPSRGDLNPKVLEAEDAAIQAEKEASAFAERINDLI